MKSSLRASRLSTVFPHEFEILVKSTNDLEVLLRFRIILDYVRILILHTVVHPKLWVNKWINCWIIVNKWVFNDLSSQIKEKDNLIISTK